MSIASLEWSPCPWVSSTCGRPRDRLAAAGGVEERVAGQPRVEQQHLVRDLDAEPGMAEPASLMVRSSHRIDARDGSPREGCRWTGFARSTAIASGPDPGYWSEPLNAVSNAAFLVAAWVGWRLARRPATAAAQALALILAGDRRRIGPLPHPRAGLGDLRRRGPDPGLHPASTSALATVRFFALALVGRACGRGPAFVPLSALAARAIERGPRTAQRLGRLPAGAAPDRAATPRRCAAGAPAAARGLAIGAGAARGLALLPHVSTRRSARPSRSAPTSSGTC